MKNLLVRHTQHNTRNELEFVQSNSNNLVSLDLCHAKDIPKNIRWPEFPALKELCIGFHRTLEIFLQSKATFDELIICFIPSASIAFAVEELPRLTDLYITSITRVNYESSYDFIF